MTEILTESFCERCGTRYTFESAAPRQKRMGGIRTLGRGLKNFVLSDDSSLDEAMAAARSDVEREATAQQLDAFHRTFNFCMSCRQYTCGNCWNGVEARCLSCAPLPEAEMAAAATAAPPADVDLERLLRLTAPPSETAWPAEAVAGAGAGAGAGPERIGAAEVDAELDAVLDARELAVDAEAAEFAEVAEVETAEAVEPVAEAVETVAAEAWAPTELPDAVPVDGGAADDLPAWAALRRPMAEAAAADGAHDGPAELVQAAEPTEAAPDGAVEPAVAEPAPTLGEAAAAPAEPGLRGLVPGESLDDAIAAYEAAEAAGAGGADAGPVTAGPATPPGDEVVAPAEAPSEGLTVGGPGIDVVQQPTWPSAPVAPLPEPVAAAPAPEAPAAVPEPVAGAPEAPPTQAPAPEPEAAPLPAAATSVPLAPPAPPPAVPAPAVPAPPVAPTQPTGVPMAPPQWPTGPRWPTGVPARQTVPPPAAATPGADPLAALMARQATEAMWAASSQDVIQPPLVAQAAASAAVQPCVSCGISLSANARFCRRCGTSQVG